MIVMFSHQGILNPTFTLSENIMSTTIETNRDYSRQSQMIPMDKVESTPVVIVGCGSIGRNVAMQLASLGSRQIALVDFDTVEQSNVTTQGYWEANNGRLKVEALREQILLIDKGIEVVFFPSRWLPKHPYNKRHVMFCCVDHISTRGKVFAGYKGPLFIDARMLRQAYYVLPVDCSSVDNRAQYVRTLFDPSERETGNSCTTQTSLHCAVVPAAQMIEQYCRYLRGQELFPLGGMMNDNRMEWSDLE